MSQIRSAVNLTGFSGFYSLAAARSDQTAKKSNQARDVSGFSLTHLSVHTSVKVKH